MYCDILPTLIDLAKGEAPGLDGKSLKSVWASDRKDTHREAVFISNVHPFWQKAIVTDSYKLIWTGHPEREHIWGNFDSKGKFFSRPWAEWKAEAAVKEDAARKVKRILSPNEFELYDVIADPYEVNDLGSRPEHRERVQDMHEKLKNLMSASGEPLTPAVTKDRKDRKRKRP